MPPRPAGNIILYFIYSDWWIIGLSKFRIGKTILFSSIQTGEIEYEFDELIIPKLLTELNFQLSESLMRNGIHENLIIEPIFGNFVVVFMWFEEEPSLGILHQMNYV